MRVQESFPTEIRSGDTVAWSHASPDFSPVDGWTLVVHLVTPATRKQVSGVAQADGTWLCTLAAADNTLAAGHATWAAVLTNTAGEQYTEATGVFTVLPNLATATGLDTRSHVQRVYDAVCHAIENAADSSELEMTIGDKAVKYMSHTELLALRREYAALLAAERNKARVRRGGRSNGSVRVKF